MKLKSLIAAAGASVALAAGQVSATPVGLELMLLVDVSGSVSTSEYNLQKTGYINAFQSAAVQNAIINSEGGAIAVTYIEWSGNSQQAQQVGWTLINDAASANAFAAAIGGTSRAFAGNTAIQAAMYLESTLFAANGFEAPRQVIDVSGDGADNNTAACNTGANARCGADQALANGVDAINGIAILGEGGLHAYYDANVRSGASGFVIDAAGFDTFATAVESKLIREITSVPEPTSAALVGLALVAGGVIRRRLSQR